MKKWKPRCYRAIVTTKKHPECAVCVWVTECLMTTEEYYDMLNVKYKKEAKR